MSDCKQCGYGNQDWATFCASCGAMMDPTGADDRCIEFLLHEIPIWRRQGIIPSGSAARLERMYRERLQRPPTSQVSGDIASGHPSPAVSPVTGETQTPPTYPDASTAPSPPEAATATPVSQSPTMAEFLEDHWLKLLAAVAAAFIIAGVRQVMGVEWLQRAGVVLLPCVPIGLSAALIRSSVKSAQPASVGARACGSIGIALVSFAITSANHRWLGDALPQRWAIALACLASSATGLWVRRATEDRTYEHYVLGFATLAAPLLTLALLETCSTLASRPWHVAASLAVMGALHLGLVGQRRTHDGPARDQRREAPFLWGSVALGVAAMLSVADAGLRGPTAIPAIMVLAACAAVSGIAARTIASAELAVGSIGAITVTGTFTVSHDPAAGNVEFGLLAVGLGVLYVVLARTCAEVRSQSGMSLSRPYNLAALAGFCVAGSLLTLRLLGWADGDQLTAAEWPRCILLAALCGSAYAGVATRLRQPGVMLASAAAFAGAIALASHRYLPLVVASIRHEAGHDFALACLVLVTIALAAYRRSPSVVSDTVWPRTWSAPWAYVGAVLGAFGVAGLCGPAGSRYTSHLAAASPSQIGAWVGILGVAVTLLTAAYTLRMSAESELPAILAGSGLATLSAAAGLLGHLLVPKGGVAAGLMVAAWCLVTASQTIQDRRSLWYPPMAVIGALAFAAAMASIAPDRGTHTVPTLALGAIGLGIAPLLTRDGHPLATCLSCCAIGAAWVIAYAPGERIPGAISYLTAASLVGTLAYGRASLQGFAPAAWMSAVTAVGTCFGIVQWIGIAPEWTLLAMLPGLAAVFAIGEFVTLPEALRSPLRRMAVMAALTGVAAHEIWQIASSSAGASPYLTATDHRASAISVGAVAALMLIGTLRRRTGPWCLAACASASLAAAHACSIEPAAAPVWAARFAICGMGYILVTLAANRNAMFHALRDELTVSTSVHASIAYVVGLLSAGMADQGVYSVMAIVIAGLTSASLFALGRGSGFAHAGVGAFLTAYMLYLYSHLGLDYGVLDLYMIPVGLYLLLLGHLADGRNRSDETQALWWTGLSVTVFPTFVAFMNHFHSGGTATHALLLVAECVAAIAWGIAHRIRAFVIVGSTFALAFAIVLGSATARHLLIGAFALTVGLAMLAAVYHLSARAAETRAWFDRIRANWQTWK